MYILFVAGITVRSTLLVAIVLALVLPIARRAIYSRLDLFEPIIMANISLAIMFVGRPIRNLITGETIHLGYDILATFDEALFVALIGIVFLQLGYFSSLGTLCARRLLVPPPFRPQKVAVLGWFYFFFGAVLFSLFLIQQGGVGVLLQLLEGRQQSNNSLFLSSTGYLYNGILMLGASSLMFFALAITAKRRLYWGWFLVSGLCLLVFYGARGTRSQMLPLLIAVPVFWYLWNRRRPQARTLVITALISVSLLGWLREVRTAGENRDLIGAAVIALYSPVDQAMDIIGGNDAEMFDSLANELLVVPERLPFQYGATITDILVRAVPRPLWPNKPLESNDAIVNTLWPEHYTLSRASPAFSVIGISYADSGYPSIALVMFLIGVLLATSWRWLQRHSDQPLAQMVYAMGLPFVVILMRGTIPDTLTRMLFLFIPLLSLLWLTRLRVSAAGLRIENRPFSNRV